MKRIRNLPIIILPLLFNIYLPTCWSHTEVIDQWKFKLALNFDRHTAAGSTDLLKDNTKIVWHTSELHRIVIKDFKNILDLKFTGDLNTRVHGLIKHMDVHTFYYFRHGHRVHVSINIPTKPRAVVSIVSTQTVLLLARRALKFI